jgi:hypothetical protein
MQAQQTILDPPAVSSDSQQRIPAPMAALSIPPKADDAPEIPGAPSSVVQKHPKKSLTAVAILAAALGGAGGHLATPGGNDPVPKTAPAPPTAVKPARLFVSIVGKRVGEPPWVAGIAGSKEIAAYCQSRGHLLLECPDDDPRLKTANLEKHLWDAGGAPALLCQVMDQGPELGKVRVKTALPQGVASVIAAIKSAETP